MKVNRSGDEELVTKRTVLVETEGCVLKIRQRPKEMNETATEIDSSGKSGWEIK